MRPWRVIFLDVDGVLNHSETEGWKTEHHVLDAACVERAKRLCDDLGARIVVSSVWRLSQESMAPILEAFGGRVIGVTPSLPGGLEERNKEIAAWLTTHSAIPMEVCVVDDEADAECVPLPFVRTSFEHGGLTENRASAIRAAFGVTP